MLVERQRQDNPPPLICDIAGSMAATASELEVLEHYNRKILRYGDNQEVLLKCLGKLDQVRINIDLLQVGPIPSSLLSLHPDVIDAKCGHNCSKLGSARLSVL